MFASTWPGSLQDASYYIASENPLEEIWAHIARTATNTELAKLKPEKQPADWDSHRAYLQVRLTQALEFRRAAHTSTLLTAPLPLYYSFLNLMRAYIALRQEVKPGKQHGLKFHAAPSLFESEASLTEGTFTDYLGYAGIAWKKGERISLRDALGCVIELWRDVTTIDPTMCHVQRIEVSAYIGREFSLRFHDHPGTLSESWRADFPTLVASCHDPDGFRLVVKEEACGKARNDVAQFLAKHLDYSLPFLGAPIWWAVRKSEPSLTLDRIGYYHVAAYILGNAVRYEPELMSEASRPESSDGWLIRRFLERAERYYPQLQLIYAGGGRQMYF
jgi:hypothetical protein